MKIKGRELTGWQPLALILLSACMILTSLVFLLSTACSVFLVFGFLSTAFSSPRDAATMLAAMLMPGAMAILVPAAFFFAARAVYRSWRRALSPPSSPPPPRRLRETSLHD